MKHHCSGMDDSIELMSSEAPNLTLNVAGTFVTAREKRFWISIGVDLQLLFM